MRRDVPKPTVDDRAAIDTGQQIFLVREPRPAPRLGGSELADYLGTFPQLQWVHSWYILIVSISSSAPFGKLKNQLPVGYRRGIDAVRASYVGESLAGSNTLLRFLALAGRSVVPEVLEAGRRQLGVAHRVLDVLVAEIGLQGPRVEAVIGELEAAGVSQHVRMHREVEVRPPRRAARPTCGIPPSGSAARATWWLALPAVAAVRCRGGTSCR